MIHDKRMRFVKSEDGYDFYLFKPSMRRLYYHGPVNDARHRYSLPHKLHMMMYLFVGGYHILYLMKGNDVCSYIIYMKAGKKIVRGSSKKDFFTVFLYTFPNFRNQGLASKMAKCLLAINSGSFDYFYKAIAKTNVPSIKVAEKVGFQRVGNATKSRLLHTVQRDENGEWYLYRYQK